METMKRIPLAHQIDAIELARTDTLEGIYADAWARRVSRETGDSSHWLVRWTKEINLKHWLTVLAIMGNSTNWNDVKAHYGEDFKTLGKENIKLVAEMLADEEGQKLIVAAANNDINIPWLPEQLEGVAFDQAFNALQYGGALLFAAGEEYLDELGDEV